MDDAIVADIETCLTSCRAAGLATVDERGQPHAANVWYVHAPDWRLFFISAPSSAHAQHIQRTTSPLLAGGVSPRGSGTTTDGETSGGELPGVAVTIHAHRGDPTQLHGLQIHGQARALEPAGPEAAAALALYGKKYPFVLTGSFAELLTLQKVYEITPTWLRWIDNRRGFGFRVEQTWEK